MTNLIDAMHQCAKQQNKDVGEIFEAVVQAAYEAIIEPGNHIIDLGAHYGDHLFPMARCTGPSGKVFAFEPIPYLYRYLKRSARQQGLRNIKFFKRAAGLNRGKSSFQHFKRYPAYSGLQRRETPFSDEQGELETIHVKQVQLDSVFNRFARFRGHTHIDFIKLDIEGGELHALMGGRALLARSRPVMVFEGGSQSSAQTYHYRKDDFFGFFESLNFHIFSLDGAAFTRETWERPPPCWEFYAIPTERLSMVERLPAFAKMVLDRYS
ncbi:MAG: FkbM family methyltransferase [Xanthomonadales bacterium]|nr:FkbM family methyltransferase [Xanthomonadales bacterium]